jgi:hypothetical protein
VERRRGRDLAGRRDREAIWQHRFPSSLETMNFNYGAGPHSTTLILGDRVFAGATDKQFSRSTRPPEECSGITTW